MAQGALYGPDIGAVVCHGLGERMAQAVKRQALADNALGRELAKELARAGLKAIGQGERLARNIRHDMIGRPGAVVEEGPKGPVNDRIAADTGFRALLLGEDTGFLIVIAPL